MSVRVMSWVWSNSTAEPSEKFVLLAIADTANDQGMEAYPSIARLAAKTGLSERSVQRSIRRLVKAGELIVHLNAGPNGTNRYQITMTPSTVTPPTDSHPRPPVTPDTVAGDTVPPPPRPPVTGGVTSATERGDTRSPETSRTTQIPIQEPSVGAVAPLTLTQRSKRITDAYAAAEPMCKWPAVNGVVMKALKSERYTDEEIRDALLRLAGEGRSVTVETLRIELNGLPPPSLPRGMVMRGGRLLKAETAANLDLVERMRERDAAEARSAIEGRRS